MKILIASVSPDGGDGVNVQAQVLAYCPTATTQIVYYNNMSDAVAYAIANGFNGIARNNGDFGSSYAQAAIAKAAGVWISWAHGANSHIYEALPNKLVDNAIGVGKGTNGVNAYSYGPSLDFFVNGAANESQACGAVAGRIAQILLDNPTWTFEQARYFLRKNSSNFPNLETDGGYGAVNLGALQYQFVPYWTPNVPTGLAGVRSSNNTSIALSWNAQVDAQSFILYRSPTVDGTFAQIAEASGTSYVDSGLDENSPYCYAIAGVNSQSEQEGSQCSPIIVISKNSLALDISSLLI